MAWRTDAQPLNCTDHPARSWWDVRHYDISIQIDTATGFLEGEVTIRAKIRQHAIDSLQIDLQPPMRIISVSKKSDYGESGLLNPLKVERAAEELDFFNAAPGIYYVRRKPGKMPFSGFGPGRDIVFTVQFEGIPKNAINPPWDGGLVRARDSAGQRWMAMACQNLGASVWLPIKDHPSDEPEDGMDIRIHVPSGVHAISNGKLIRKRSAPEGDIWHWAVTNPINTYNITFYLGNYICLEDSFSGLNGRLDLQYYVLPPHRRAAEKQFGQVKPMLRCFETYFGPFPFYEDGYKIVESPYLGMEHQSAIAYGNKFTNGYLGKDRSSSGTGLLFDFILIHESAHEWFGNSISVADKADTWVQEGFTTYAETLYAEWIAGKAAALAYQRGKKQLIRNDRPVTGQHGACDPGSPDHYDKAAYMLHMIRVLVADDAIFFSMLRELNRRFFHQVVTGRQVEAFLSDYLHSGPAKIRLSPAFFNQYLREADLPVLELRKTADRWLYRWGSCSPGFDMPVIWAQAGVQHYIYPAADFKELPVEAGFSPEYLLPDFLIDIRID